MKQIIDGKLYDTEKARYVLTLYSQKMYITQKGLLFTTTEREGIYETSQRKLKLLLGKYFPDKYIELFGEVEEA